jgi:hypothetical protein
MIPKIAHKDPKISYGKPENYLFLSKISPVNDVKENIEEINLNTDKKEIINEITRIKSLLQELEELNKQLNKELFVIISDKNQKYEGKIDKSTKLQGMILFNNQKIDLMNKQIESYENQINGIEAQIRLLKIDYQTRGIIDSQNDCNTVLDTLKKRYQDILPLFADYIQLYSNTIDSANLFYKKNSIVSKYTQKSIKLNKNNLDIIEIINNLSTFLNNIQPLNIKFYEQNDR